LRAAPAFVRTLAGGCTLRATPAFFCSSMAFNRLRSHTRFSQRPSFGGSARLGWRTSLDWLFGLRGMDLGGTPNLSRWLNFASNASFASDRLRSDTRFSQRPSFGGNARLGWCTSLDCLLDLRGTDLGSTPNLSRWLNFASNASFAFDRLRSDTRFGQRPSFGGSTSLDCLFDLRGMGLGGTPNLCRRNLAANGSTYTSNLFTKRSFLGRYLCDTSCLARSSGNTSFGLSNGALCLSRDGSWFHSLGTDVGLCIGRKLPGLWNPTS